MLQTAIPLILFFTTILHTSPSLADYTYNVHSTFLFLRTGDRTPRTLATTASTLTPYGAQQLFSAGSFFRDRYITNSFSASNATSDLNTSPINGISVTTALDEQLYLLAMDKQFAIASATAFMQGFYPPFSVMNGGNGGNLGEGDGVLTTLNQLGLLGNGTYIEAPLSGYQYPSIHVASADDPASIYTSGSLECPALDLSTNTYYSSSAFHALANSAAMLYTSIGSAFLQSILPPIAWGYGNAYAIYDYISYLAAHNTSIYSAFTEPSYGWREQGDQYSDLDRLRWLADAEMTAFLGNVSVPHPLGLTFETATQGSISTIAGATLAANVLEAFLWNTLSAGSENKVNVLVGDFDAFVSFFALAGLANLNSNFDGLPAYGSAMAFELFSLTDSPSSSSSDANATFPDDGQLWVRFLFRNGTDSSTFSSADAELGGLQSYPLFGRGPSETDIPYTTFVSLMQQVAIASPGDWCTMCVASSVFCAAWNQTESTSSEASAAKKGMSPVIAGVVGAVIAIPAAALLLLAIAIPCGLRVRRVKKDRQSHAGGELGGFKGGSKLGSDPDLTLSKGGAHVGAIVEREPSVSAEESKKDAEFRERLGSWEMKETDVERIRGFGRSSVESFDVGVQPVRPDERV